MPVIVRPMQAAEARRLLEIHYESVRGLVVDNYPPAAISFVICRFAAPEPIVTNPADS